MKTKIMKTLFVALLGTGLASTAYAESSQVKFSGKILAESCTVVTPDKTKTVVLGNYNKSVFTAVGTTSTKVPFSITLEDCDTQPVRMRYQGTAVSGSPEILALTGGAGFAQGVGVVVYEQGGANPITVGDYTARKNATSGTNLTFNFEAAYKRHGTLVAGKADASADLIIDYN